MVIIQVASVLCQFTQSLVQKYKAIVKTSDLTAVHIHGAEEHCAIVNNNLGCPPSIVTYMHHPLSVCTLSG